MKRIMLASITIIAVLVICSSACIWPIPTPAPSPSPFPGSQQFGQELKSNKQWITSPAVNQADLSAVEDDNNIFALNTYQTLKDDSNLFFSPYSLYLALAMTYAGARDETQQQMAQTVNFTLPQERFHPALNKLNLAILSRGKGAKGKNGEPFQLDIANAIWGQKNFEFQPDYLDVLAENYGAGLRILDFKMAPENSRTTINNWVSSQTNGKIKDLLPSGAIQDITRLVLTDAIYFNAAWQNTFKKSPTENGPFYLLDDSQVIVPMMSQTQSFGYTDGNGYQVVELPYDGRELSMVIMLPDRGQFEIFEKSLDARHVDAIVNDLKTSEIFITMPRFEFTSGFSLRKTLSDMGMPLPFARTSLSGECSSDYANFSGMTGKCDLYISDIFHEAFISVDETGTEAAAATHVIMFGAGAAAPPRRVIIDHPFIFLIRDIQTGAILFIGRVMNPSI
jgi:serpin B